MNENEFYLSPVFCLHNGAVILERSSHGLTIGMINVQDVPLKERLVRAAESCFQNQNEKAAVSFVSVSPDELKKNVGRLMEQKSFGAVPVKEAEKIILPQANENQIAALLDSIILSAGAKNASDVHIEECGVRFRIGGTLQLQSVLKEEMRNALVQRIKLLARLNVVEKRRGQDGQFVFEAEGKKIFVRVSCLPAVSSSGDGLGESIVLRLLDPSRIPLNLHELGIESSELEKIRSLCFLSSGLVLVCGPTGSGKSTTAGAMLSFIMEKCGNSKKIISLEDPPEYVLPGVTQIRIHREHDMDFAEALRRTFRQDPDVILIGEIRDGETACSAVQTAMTGHLVIATIHTGSAFQAVLRLCELGADEKVIKSVLRGVILQHLECGKVNAQVSVVNESAEEKIVC